VSNGRIKRGGLLQGASGIVACFAVANIRQRKSSMATTPNYVDGMNLRRTARHLGIHHSTVSAWVRAHVRNLPQAPQPKKVKTAEMDELFTFIGNKKTKSIS